MSRWPNPNLQREPHTYSLARETPSKLNRLAAELTLALGNHVNPGRVIDILVQQATPQTVLAGFVRSDQVVSALGEAASAEAPQ